MISAITFGQKKEIKSAEKAIKSGDFTEAISILDNAQSLIANADKTLKTKYYLLKGNAYIGAAGDTNLDQLVKASESLLKAKELSPKDQEVITQLDNLRVVLVNGAVADRDGGNYASASEKLYRGYSVSTTDTIYLYFSAQNAIRAKEYDRALEHYNNLLNMGYTGIKKEYYATNKSTKVEEKFDTKDGRDQALKDGTHNVSKDKNTVSKKGEILKNMTLIYNSLGQAEKAKELIQAARAENPDDVDLMHSEANMYLEMGDIQNYKKVISQIIEKDPNNPDLYYNLGVTSKRKGELDTAMQYYDKVLEIDPNYINALINKADLYNSKTNALLDEMNELGTSSADYNKYDELQEVRIGLFKEAIPLLEKALSLSGDRADIMNILKDLYGQVGMDDKAKDMKNRISALEGGK